MREMAAQAAISLIYVWKQNEKVSKRNPVAVLRQGLNICTGWDLHMLVYSVLNIVSVANSILNELADNVGVVVEIK